MFFEKGLLDILGDTWMDLHPIVSHFPIALLVVSVILSFIALWKPNFQQTSWITLLIGTIASIPANITGIISHIPYEETALYEMVELHQFISFAVTPIFVGLTIWRWRLRQRGVEVETTWLYLGLASIGLVVLVLSGMTGGDLVFDYGVGVRGINPLLK